MDARAKIRETPQTILIADDNEAVRSIVRTILEGAGYTVCAEAADGLDAVQKAIDLSPGLVVVDIRMPKMSGIEVASVLRGRLPGVPVVLLTMNEANPHIVSAAGVAAMVEKSEATTKLAERVRELLAAAEKKKI